ncbi:MAG TPA: PSD1 and planctomycete cytochrome C domain-containing protein [Planctomycetota bacterium]
MSILTWTLLALASPQDAAEDREKRGLELFERRVRPILVDSCYECHSLGAKKVKGEFLVDSRDALMKGGSSGPSLVPGDPDKSLLVLAVRWATEDLKMPPKKAMPPDDVRAVEEWVKLGAPHPKALGADATPAPRKPLDLAKAREFWSLRPVSDPPPPAVKNAAWPASDVDRFLLAELEARGLTPAVDADRRALIRRVTFDLHGLPPTPEEVEAFVADGDYAKVVERLLASPRYGERWGRHWLDVVRYSDTAGDNSDYPVPQLYRYRDYVIEAFNRDVPYDRFITEQLAGDLLPAATEVERRRHIVATGYVASAKRYGSRVDDYPWHLTYEDTIDNLGRTFLALTLSCARCHDHKFDPILIDDYYALYGIFASTKYTWPGIELDKVQRDLVPLETPDVVEPLRRARADEAAILNAEIKAEKDKKAQEKLKKALENLEKAPLPFETAYGVVEAEKAVDAKIQFKGNPEKPGALVRRGFLKVLGGQTVTGADSGRRELAAWLGDPANPLTARVMVNRIWQQHFGRGIVPTSSDFGKQGKPPTHPALLDWLAKRFVEKGWSVKAMHRLIVHSRAYRMSSAPDAANAAIDPSNERLWRFPRRRLDAESLRDALLAVSGGLDLAPGGAHPFPEPKAWDFTQHKPFKAVYDTNKRSVYLMTQRFAKHPFLGIFDGADPNFSTASRVTSTTTLQALWFLNDPFFHERAKGFAQQFKGDIPRAYDLAFGRPPTDAELAAGREFIAKSDTESYARALLRLGEFIYVD